MLTGLSCRCFIALINYQFVDAQARDMAFNGSMNGSNADTKKNVWLFMCAMTQILKCEYVERMPLQEKKNKSLKFSDEHLISN